MPATPLSPDFTGVVAASLTPFTAAGAVDGDAVAGLVEFLLEGGVAGLMIGGTTGEFIALTTEERCALLEAFVKAVQGRVPVIAHIGHVHLVQAQELARRAADAGANALTALTPYYHRTSAAAIEATMRDLARTVPQLPFLVYNYPDAAGNPLPYALFEALLDEPNLAGVKLSVGSLDEIRPYTAVLDRVCVLSGNDGLMPDVVALGATAVVSGNAAAFPDLVSELLRGLLDERSSSPKGVSAPMRSSSPKGVSAPMRSSSPNAPLERASADASGLLAALSAASRGGSPDRLRELLRRRGIDIGPGRVRTYVPADVDPAEDERLFAVLSHAVGR